MRLQQGSALPTTPFVEPMLRRPKCGEESLVMGEGRGGRQPHIITAMRDGRSHTGRLWQLSGALLVTVKRRP